MRFATTATTRFRPFTSLDYPGATDTAAYGINSAGQIVGSYSSKDDPINVRGFLYGPK
jgi:uncharacterized membrane protein